MMASPVDFRHRRGRFAFHDRVDGGVRREAVGLDDLPDVAEPVEQRGRADDQLELEVGMSLDGLQDRLDPAVVRAAIDDDADLAPGLTPCHPDPPR